jgi:hypothetical protein
MEEDKAVAEKRQKLREEKGNFETALSSIGELHGVFGLDGNGRPFDQQTDTGSAPQRQGSGSEYYDDTVAGEA